MLYIDGIWYPIDYKTDKPDRSSGLDSGLESNHTSSTYASYVVNQHHQLTSGGAFEPVGSSFDAFGVHNSSFVVQYITDHHTVQVRR